MTPLGENLLNLILKLSVETLPFTLLCFFAIREIVREGKRGEREDWKGKDRNLER